jgi:hypothetical protein
MRTQKQAIFWMVLILVLVFSSQASAWSVLSKWQCCGKNPKERVKIVCKTGFAPVFVNVNGKWYLKKEGQGDGQGTAHPSLDAAAKDFCKE